MDEYSRKRSAGGFGFSRRGSSLSFREPNHEDRGVQYCNRLGCSTRLNSMKSTELGTPEKPKYPRTSFRSMSSKSAGASSSKPFAASTDFGKSHQQLPNRASSRDTVESSSSRHRVVEEDESSSQLGDTEGSDFKPMITGIQTILPDSEDLESSTAQRLSTLSTEPSGSRVSRPRKQINRCVGSSSQDVPSSSPSVWHPIATKNTGHVTKPSSQYLGYGPPKYGLKNLGCSSISDALPSGCSSDHGQSRRVASVRKRASVGESSSSGGKSSSGSSTSSISGQNVSLIPQQAPRRARNRPLSRDGPVSVRTRQAPGGEARTRLPEHQGDDNLLVSGPSAYPQLPHTQLTIHEVVPENPSRSFPMEPPPPIFPSSFGGRPSSSGRSARSRLVSSRLEDSSNREPLGDREGYRRFNMEGIAEVLLALERIEQDDELTYEQLLVLETNLFLGGFSFHDQHRDMRLDIDNMTYEELLALEEKMGSVSTALSEEALSKCVKRSNYEPACRFSGIAAYGDDDIKCSICQEEYIAGDEVGKLACDHHYHVDCIHQWLRQKNWCPICKTAAASHATEEAK